MEAHEFVDEHMFEQNCLEAALQNYPSRSGSVSSQDSCVICCCGRRSNRNTLPHGGDTLSPVSPRTPLQELSALHIQSSTLSVQPSSRSNLNLRAEDSGRVNCKGGGRVTTAIISLPSPPSLIPDREAHHHHHPLAPGQRRAPPQTASIQTTASSTPTSIVKVSAL